VWDEGTYEPEGGVSAREQIDRGELKFALHGKKLKGSFVLVKLRGNRTGKPGKEWLLIKHRDEYAHPGWTVNDDPKSVLSGRCLSAQNENAVKSAATEAGVAAATPAKGRAAGKAGTIQFPAGAKRAPMPDKMTAALATLADEPFSDPGWLFEIKWDGERTLARVKNGELQLWSRSQRNITGEYPDLAEIAGDVGGHDVWLDGEIVTLDADGRSDFGKLQQRFSVRAPSRALMEKVPVIYYGFDLLYCDGHDLRAVPLIERKNLLAQILNPSERVRYSDHQMAQGKELYELAAAKGLEGIIGKQAQGSYPQGRTRSWLKFKLGKDLDAVVGGWTDPRKSREHFGALLVGLYEKGKLEFVASVGTGFTVAVQAALAKQLATLATRKCPFAEAPSMAAKAHWVTPELVARVGYANWTEGRSLRAPRFQGLQPDRRPEECTFEKEMTPVATAVAVDHADAAAAPDDDSESHTEKKKTNHAKHHIAPTERARGAGAQKLAEELASGSANQFTAEVEGRTLQLTNLDKVYFPGDGYTKRDLLRHYLIGWRPRRLRLTAASTTRFATSCATTCRHFYT
jgi:bifunctional non-homologous end joining protein LigD